jgi:hypothetical protein
LPHRSQFVLHHIDDNVIIVHQCDENFINSTKYQNMIKDAIFSKCGKYRYVLSRDWSGKTNEPYVLFVGLNPSTADEITDDPTIRRCIKFAHDWGYSKMCMVNLFAFRATNPNHMLSANDPIGIDNNGWLAQLTNNAHITIAAWGNNGGFMGRSSYFFEKNNNIFCLGVTLKGQPKHPLYLKKTEIPRLINEQNGTLLNGRL